MSRKKEETPVIEIDADKLEDAVNEIEQNHFVNEFFHQD